RQRQAFANHLAGRFRTVYRRGWRTCRGARCSTAGCTRCRQTAEGNGEVSQTHVGIARERGFESMNEPVFLITGASTGIGAATARRALASGYRLVLVARDLARLTELSNSLGESERVMPLACDVQDWNGQAQMVEQALARFGRLDVAFGNAGQQPVSNFDTGCFLGDGTRSTSAPRAKPNARSTALRRVRRLWTEARTWWTVPPLRRDG